MASLFHRVDVYDAKVSLRTKLHILKTIAKQLAYKEDRYNLFKKSVFGPWLNLRTEEHDNHMLNFLLQHQRIIDNPSTNVLFYFDIGHHSLEFGRKEFCLLTGFRFGDCSLKHLRNRVSSFRNRVFPSIKNLKGIDLLPLVETDADFNRLLDDDVVRVCLLLALEYVFMGYELRHVIVDELLNLVDDLSAWNEFPWGERIWKGFHGSVYNICSKNRKVHLDKIASLGPKFKPQYSLNGFVFPLKIWVLETFLNSRNWWHKKEKAIPRCVAWSDGMKFQKTDPETLFYSRIQINTLEPTDKEINTPWWSSSVEYFENGSMGTPISDRPAKKKKKEVVKRTEVTFETHVRIEIHREVHVRTEIHREVHREGLGEAALAHKIVAKARDFGGRITAIEQYLEIPKTSSGSDNLMEVDDDFKVSDNPANLEQKFEYIKNNFQRRITAIEQHVKPSSGSDNHVKNGVNECMDTDHDPKVFKTVTPDDAKLHPSLDIDPDPESVEEENVFRGLDSEAGPSETRAPNLAEVEENTAEVMEDINGAKVNVDPQRLESTFKLIIDSPINDQRVNEQEVAMSDLLFEEEEQQKSLNNLVYSDLEGQELMAVDALMNIIDFDNTPKQEKHNELDTLSMQNTNFVQGSNDDNETFVDVLVVDDDQPDVKTIRVPFSRETRLSKYLQSPYTNPPDSTPQQPKLRDRTKKCKKHFLPLIGPDGEEIPPWNEDLNRVKGAPKNRVDVPKYILSNLRENKEDEKGFYFPWAQDTALVKNIFWERLLGFGQEGRNGWLSCTHLDLWVLYLWHFRPTDGDWVMVGPFFSTMILNNRMPYYYADGVTYGTPWFAESVEKVYFPINETEHHWVLAELRLRTGVITIYDSLCPTLPFVEERKWWLEMRKSFSSKIPRYLKRSEVMDRKHIDEKNYKITFLYADNVPRQGNLYGDCGIWVMINIYRLTHILSLEVKNPTLAALAYRERLTDLFWKYKIAP